MSDKPIVTRAERDRRIMMIRCVLLDLRSMFTDSLFWRWYIKSAGFKMLDQAIDMLDSLLALERSSERDE